MCARLYGVCVCEYVYMHVCVHSRVGVETQHYPPQIFNWGSPIVTKQPQHLGKTYLSLRNLTAFTGLGNSRMATSSFFRSSHITTKKQFESNQSKDRK